MHDDDTGLHAPGLPADLAGAFDYQEGPIVPNTPKKNALLTSGVLWSSALFMTAYLGAILAPIFGEGGNIWIQLVVSIVFLTQGAVSFAAIVWFQHMMRYTEVDFDTRSIRLPTNAVVPYGLPRTSVPFAEVGNIRVISKVHSTGKSLHRFEFLPYQSDKPIACISQRREKDWDPAETLAALKRTVITPDTPTDDIFLSALTQVPKMPVSHS